MPLSKVDVAGEGKRASCGFTDQSGALGILERHDEVLTGAGTDPINEQDQAAGVRLIEWMHDGVASSDRRVLGVGGIIAAQERAAVERTGFRPGLIGLAHQRRL